MVERRERLKVLVVGRKGESRHDQERWCNMNELRGNCRLERVSLRHKEVDKHVTK